MNLMLVNKRQEVENVQSFSFKIDPEINWKAGQFMRYIIDDPHPDERRNYRFFSISSAPFEKNITLTTRFAPLNGSSFKRDLRNLNIGDKIEATGPSGDFVVEDPDERSLSANKSYVFIAGGIGITPFRSITLDLDHKNQPVNITLLYANRTPDFIFKQELESVQKRHPEFKIEYFVDPVRIDEAAINSALSTLNSPLFYISGPEPMVEVFEDMVYKMGVPKKLVKRDYFPGYTTI